MIDSVFQSPWAPLLIVVLAASMVAAYLRTAFEDKLGPKWTPLASLAVGGVIGLIVALTADDQAGMLAVCGAAGAAADFLPTTIKRLLNARADKKGPQHAEIDEGDRPL